MGKEIERKWLFNYDKYDVYEYCNNLPYIEIKDYYFNQYCRWRNINNEKFFITVKSEGNMVREEFEFPIDKNNIKYLLRPLLCKTRYLTNEGKEYPYEINIFKDIRIVVNGKLVPLVIVEREHDNVYDLSADKLLDICGEEKTEDEEYYGYNLYNMFKENLADIYPNNLNSKIVNMQDFLDKRK
jgi:CYTH domain-containing protein